MNNRDAPSYYDYREKIDPNDNIEINVDSEVVVNSRTHIKIIFKAKQEYPVRTQFRFIIPYGWRAIDLQNDFCSVDSSVKGTVKLTNSQIELLYILKQPLNKGDFIEFNYNKSKTKHTASELAYFDKVICALDVKYLKDKLFTRIGKKEIKMVSEKASIFLVKLPTIYQGVPMDIQITALDKFGNRDHNFNGEIDIDGDNCLIFPKCAKIEEGYVKLEKTLTFKNISETETRIKKLLKENRGYGDFPVVKEILEKIGKLYVSSGEIKGNSNPIVWDDDYSKNLLQVYWGDTHIHTREFSDGIGTGRDGFHYAKNEILHDFAALGDHLNQRFNRWMEGRKAGLFPYTQQVWKSLVNLCKEFTDDSFSAIPAYEWSGRVIYAKSVLNLDCPYDMISDKVILFPLDSAENAPLVDYASKGGCYQDQLYKILKDVECAIISHTPISWSMGTSWSEVNNKYEKVVEIYSQHGSSEEYGGGYRPLITNRKGSSVQAALNKGFKLAFIGGGDDHYTHPGRPVKQYKLRKVASSLRYKPGIAGIFSDQLNSKSLIKSLNERKCYATTGERMWIKIKINSSLMGQETDVSEPPIIIITVCGTSQVESVELIKNGKKIAVRAPADDRIKFAYKDDELKSGEEAYYYIRVTQFDGERGWSSPIWVRANFN